MFLYALPVTDSNISISTLAPMSESQPRWSRFYIAIRGSFVAHPEHTVRKRLRRVFYSVSTGVVRRFKKGERLADSPYGAAGYPSFSTTHYPGIIVDRDLGRMVRHGKIYHICPTIDRFRVDPQ